MKIELNKSYNKRLKITERHYLDVLEKIDEVLKNRPEVVADYQHGRFVRSAAVKDLDRRFRWDLISMAVPSKWLCETLYPYIDDRHIDSALAHMLPKIERLY